MRQKVAINLSEIIQGNNFSGIVSNIFTSKLDVSLYKEYSEQRYPDLMGPNNIGLEVKASIKAWEGGEGHNGHSGWHIVCCYRILESGDIEFTQIEIANLIKFGVGNSDWKYQGSARNSNDSQRTETYITTDIGTAKLRDGSLYWRSDLCPLTPQRQSFRERLAATLPIPSFSPFFQS